MKLLVHVNTEAERRRKIGETRRKLFAKGKLRTTKGRVTRKNLAWSDESKQRLSDTRKLMYVEGELSRRSPNKILVVPKVELDSEFGNWLAGFSDGEACFSVTKLSGHGKSGYEGSLQCIFKITLRRDDAEVLLNIQKRLGFGNIGYAKMKAMRKDGTVRITRTVSFSVQAAAHCMALINVFKRFRLRAKKQRDFEIWSQLVQICFKQDGAKYAMHRILVDKLQCGKKYRRNLRLLPMVETA